MTVVALLEIELHLPASQSLKQKRSVVKSLRDRTSRKFNVSVAEVDHLDKWQLAGLAFSMVSSDQSHVEAQIQNLLGTIEREIMGSAVIVRQDLSFL